MADIKDRMKNGIDNLADAGKRVADQAPDAVNRLADVAGKVQERAQGLVDDVQEKAHAVADCVSDTAQRGVRAAETAGAKAQEYGQDVADLVKRYPFHALMVGFGAGFLLSRLSR